MSFSSDPIFNLENLSSKNKTKSLSIYLFVVIGLISFLICLPIIEVDVSSQSRGMVRPIKDNTPISTTVNGKLHYVNLINNQNVIKGDTLLKITQDNLKSKQSFNDSILAIIIIQFEDISQLLNDKTGNFKDQTVIENYNQNKAKIRELETRVKQASQTYNRNSILYKKQVIAKAKYESHLYNFKSAKDALNSYIQEQKSKWQQQKRELEVQIQDLLSKQEQFIANAENFVITAPISGTLENVIGLQIGSFVNSAQVLCVISPNGSLIVENNVTPNDIGLLIKGQKVKFQLDAFNYNQWGMLEGEIIDIDKNVTLQEKAAFFKVRCSLYSNHLQLKSGYKTQVKKGMTLTTRYFITRRSLYDLLFDKVDDWLNPKLIE